MLTKRLASRFAPGLGLLLALVCFPSAAFAEARDPRAVEIAQDVLAAMGGENAWAATRFIRFNFFGFRLHHWDRHTGRHRFEGKDRNGGTYIVLHNVKTREGTVRVNGGLLEGEDEAEWLQRAYDAWINDTYWLVMPFKLMDPGVNLAYDGEEQLGGVTFDKLKLTFESVGRTPGDTYWAYINRETHLMERWAYFLEDWEEGREPSHWQWLDWGSYGQIMLSPRRVHVTDGSDRPLSELAVFDHLSDSVFESAGPVAYE